MSSTATINRSLTPTYCIGRPVGECNESSNLPSISLAPLKNTLIFEHTGDKKSDLVFAPLIKAYTEETNSGCLVLDGSYSLVENVTDITPCLTVVSPSTTPCYNPISGLEAEDVVNIIFSNAPSGDSTLEWHGREHLLSAALLLETAAYNNDAANPDAIAWNISCLYKAAMSPSYRDQFFDACTEGSDYCKEAAKKSCDFFRTQNTRLKANVCSNILDTITSWFAPLVDNNALDPWTKITGQSDISAADVLRGERYIFDLPEVFYDRASRIVQNLAIGQLLCAARKKGDIRRPCAIFANHIDELTCWQFHELPALAKSHDIALVFGVKSLDRIQQHVNTDHFLQMLILLSEYTTATTSMCIAKRAKTKTNIFAPEYADRAFCILCDDNLQYARYADFVAF